MTKFSYLQRLKQRKHLAQLKEQIVFGLTLGWLMTLVGGFHYLFVINTHDNLWKVLLYIGIGLIAISIILPSAISLFQNFLQKLTEKIGEKIFILILLASYFLFILPIGVLLRRQKTNNSFYAWQDKIMDQVEGWIQWENREDIQPLQPGAKKRPLMLQLAWVIAYFIRNGHYLLIPVLVLLLVLGLIMFFVKASALAPFIYTLF
ncbi:DUF5989 family protein [uncultured Nostoc sp.]|uniref:DUF5989 family protein n=1 Tax=uncultured Nostoc sp. TaxID=340711 RepID=UPI0035CB671C